MKQWGRVWRFSLPKLMAAMKMVPNIVKDRDFLYKMKSVWFGYQRQCFMREVIDHQRITLEKNKPG
jgi:hypothetical protein